MSDDSRHLPLQPDSSPTRTAHRRPPDGFDEPMDEENLKNKEGV